MTAEGVLVDEGDSMLVAIYSLVAAGIDTSYFHSLVHYLVMGVAVTDRSSLEAVQFENLPPYLSGAYSYCCPFKECRLPLCAMQRRSFPSWEH